MPFPSLRSLWLRQTLIWHPGDDHPRIYVAEAYVGSTGRKFAGTVKPDYIQQWWITLP